MAALFAAGATRVDGAEVERISTPCLQVLAAAAASARRRGQEFAVQRPSEVLLAAIADLGLTHAIPVEN